MSLVRFRSIQGITVVKAAAISGGGGTGTPEVAGYSVTTISEIDGSSYGTYQVDLDGLVGPFSFSGFDASGQETVSAARVDLVADDELIDTTVTDPPDNASISAAAASAATAASQATTAATQSTAAAADAATAATQTSKASIRTAVGGRWTDEDGKTFDLSIEDTP